MEQLIKDPATLLPPEQDNVTPPTAGLVKCETPMELLSAALSQGLDLDKLKLFMDLRDRDVAEKRRVAFSEAMAIVKPKLPRIIRTKDGQHNKYAPLEDINAIVDPILQEQGLWTSGKIVSQTEKSVTVRAELHYQGYVEWTDICMPLDKTGPKGEVNKNEPDALASSITRGRRIALSTLLN